MINAGDAGVAGGSGAAGGPQLWESEVMRSLRPVLEASSHVQTSLAGIEKVASWLAYEGFEFPAGPIDGALGGHDTAERLIDVYFFYGIMNFAFTDFDTGVKFSTEYRGATWSDSMAMFACAHRALEGGVRLYDGRYWAEMTSADLAAVFSGNIPIPMPAERLRILNEVGATLARDYGGYPHRFVRDCASQLYADGDGLLERLAAEFPRFDDTSIFRGNPVQFHKLSQLFCWTLHMPLALSGDFAVADLTRMTAFADYILPVALRSLGIQSYTPELAAAIDSGVHIAAGGEQEVEIRAHTLYAMGLLTDSVNRLRPASMDVIVPQVDLRLWRAYHATHRPHHLTRTILY